MNIKNHYRVKKNGKTKRLLRRNQSMIISYLAMRRLIGFLGISLPVIMVIGGFIQKGFAIQDSISSYYFTNMRDFFVGIVCGVSLFLLSYRGYELIDDIVTNISGIFALGLFLFPTVIDSGKSLHVGMFMLDDRLSGYIHLTFGALFFLALAYNSLFLFTKSETKYISREKRRRNIIYRICGSVMITSILFMIVFLVFFKDTSLASAKPVFICESISLLAFGISWLVKGNTLFKDKKV